MIDTAFPHDSTANQWFDEDQVKSYRELGSWIGGRVSEKLFDKLGDEAWRVDEMVRQWEERLEAQQEPSSGGRAAGLMPLDAGSQRAAQELEVLKAE